jgi:hypothetical protein
MQLWSHFYKCLFNLCIYCYHENLINCLHATSDLKTLWNVRTTTNVWIATKSTCKCYQVVSCVEYQF